MSDSITDSHPTSPSPRRKRVINLDRKGAPEELAEQYISFCLSSEPARLPNMAGFFRWMRLSASARDRFKTDHPEEYMTIIMFFEDEALNSPLPPSIVSAYMKQYFSIEEHPAENNDGITLIFEHDILHDGE